MMLIDKLGQSIGAENILRFYDPKPARIFVWINKEKLKEAIRFLKSQGFTHLSAITGLEVEDGTELLYHLSNGGIELTLRIKLSLNKDFAPTITDIIPGAVHYRSDSCPCDRINSIVIDYIDL